MRIWIRRGMALGLLALVQLGVYLETGWVTSFAVGVILLAVAGLDRRTRQHSADDALAAMRKMVGGLQANDHVKLPDEKEGGDLG